MGLSGCLTGHALAENELEQIISNSLGNTRQGFYCSSRILGSRFNPHTSLQIVKGAPFGKTSITQETYCRRRYDWIRLNRDHLAWCRSMDELRAINKFPAADLPTSWPCAY